MHSIREKKSSLLKVPSDNRYRGLILDLKDYYGEVYIYQNTFEKIQTPLSSCIVNGSITIPNYASTYSDPNQWLAIDDKEYL